MQKSYWKYLSVWEKEEWAQLKEEYRSKTRTSEQVGYTVDDDDIFIGELIADGIYNPLEDTRPYYYATYKDVRGTGQTYVNRGVPSGNDYIIDSNKGDEFQMNTRSGTESFMDILNRNVVFQTQRRIYGNSEPPPDSEWETETFKGQVKWYEQKIDTLVG